MTIAKAVLLVPNPSTGVSSIKETALTPVNVTPPSPSLETNLIDLKSVLIGSVILNSYSYTIKYYLLLS